MRINITVTSIGGGFRKAIFGQTRDRETGEWCVDSVFGRDDDELLERLKARIPLLGTRYGISNLTPEAQQWIQHLKR